MGEDNTFLLEKDEDNLEIAKIMEEYAEYREKEGPDYKNIAADQIPPELKKEMNLDMLPEDIQNDIISLAQKLLDYAVDISEKFDQEAPDPFLTRLGKCLTTTPVREIGRDAWQGAKTAHTLGTFLPTPVGNAIKPFIGILGGAATAGAGVAGWNLGCMTKTLGTFSQKPPMGGQKPPISGQKPPMSSQRRPMR